MKNIIVCGSRFGQFYIEALKRMEGINIVGLLAKGSKRSCECANYYAIPMYASIDEIKEKVDVACVAVKTGTLGGEGAILAKQLLDKKINVLLEQPVHYKELGECYKTARNQNVYFGVGNLYLNLPAVNNFMRNVEIIKKEEKISYINVDLATQVSYPVISILGEVLETLRPWKNIGEINGKIPFQTQSIKLGNIPVNFRAHNEIDRGKIDGFLHLLFQISVGFPSGHLTLCDPHGPVIWNPRIHFPDENIIPGRLKDISASNLDETNTVTLYSNEKTQNTIFMEEWPRAIVKDIERVLKNPIEVDNKNMQKVLSDSQAWQLLMKGLGYPEIVNGSVYEFFSSENLLREKNHFSEKCDSIIGGMALFNDICLKTMYYYLQCNIEEDSKGYTNSELIAHMEIREQFIPIIHRWIDMLSLNGYIRNERGKYYFDYRMDYLDLKKIWSDGECNWIKTKLGQLSTYEYFRNNALRLKEIMNGGLNPAHLLFPKGQMCIADDLYSRTPISIYYNHIIAEYIQKECNHRNSCKLLELGGGTASTTKCILDTIKKCDVERYYFTDISDFFVNHARELFSNIRFVDYLKINIDDNFAKNKIKENSIDILVAIGVLNNAQNIENTLKNIRKVLKNDGQAIIVEAIDESVQMLISQAFMMVDTNDERAENNETFLKLGQWYELFRKVGFTVKKSMPTIDSELCVYNQKVFILNCKSEVECDENK